MENGFRMKNITETTIKKIQNSLVEKYGNENKPMIERGVSHAASLWRASDGSETEFEAFCLEKFPLMKSKTSGEDLILNGAVASISQICSAPVYRFEPSGGWKGAIES